MQEGHAWKAMAKAMIPWIPCVARVNMKAADPGAEASDDGARSL